MALEIIKGRMREIYKGLAPHLNIHTFASIGDASDGDCSGMILFLRRLLREGNSCSFGAACTSLDPIFVGAVAETEEKLVVLLAPGCRLTICDSAHIPSITVGPLSD